MLYLPNIIEQHCTTGYKFMVSVSQTDSFLVNIQRPMNLRCTLWEKGKIVDDCDTQQSLLFENDDTRELK